MIVDQQSCNLNAIHFSQWKQMDHSVVLFLPLIKKKNYLYLTSIKKGIKSSDLYTQEHKTFRFDTSISLEEESLLASQ